MAINNNNDIANIFKEVAECLCENKAFHKSAYSVYRWLSISGFKRMHMYKSMCYGMKELELENIATMLNIRIPEFEYPKVEVVSYNFFNGDRINSSDEQAVKNTVKTIFESWLKMEQENLEFYNDIFHSLLLDKRTSKDTTLSFFLKCLFKESQCKIKWLTKKIMNYKAISYSPMVLLAEQKCYHKKYKKKLKSVGKMH